MSVSEEILHSFWGYSTFRPKQKEIIEAVLSGEDVLALLPTGGGKSVCFQVPGLAMEGVCLVVSPLIALMKDQVESLRKKNIIAEALFSGQSYREMDRILDNCVFGNVRFLYVSPERLKSKTFLERFSRMKINLIAVDEAHCISEWGYDFRPSYLGIHLLREIKPDVPILALTATATPKVQEDIQSKLRLKHARIYRTSFVRTGLSLSCIRTEQIEQELLRQIRQEEGTGIIYVRSRKATKEMCQFLIRNKLSVTFYHAGLNFKDRALAMEAWMSGKARIIVATNAFGMGIDKDNVRFVYHCDLPESLEAYYQEAGRAGRDGVPSNCILFYNDSSIRQAREKIEKAFPSAEYIRQVYQHLANYFRLAIGSAELESFDFDIDHFRTQFKLELIPAYNALKKLEDDGFLQLNEFFHTPSKLHIPVSYEKLYEFQIKYPAQDLYIKAILRLYGGDLFQHYLSISESKLARYLQVSDSEVVKHLESLKKQGVLEYEPANGKPKLTYLTPRLDPQTMPLQKKRLEELKMRKTEKQEEMIQYARNGLLCRMVFVLEYFGETSGTKKCGKCDVCLQKGTEDKEIHRLLQLEVVQNKLDIEQFCLAHPLFLKEKVVEIYRNLLFD